MRGNFFIGTLELQKGSKEKAKRLFQVAASHCPRTFLEWRAAVAELKALEGK
jgi:lipoprotein NlpI